MFKKWLNARYQNFLRILYIQIALLFIYLPILIYWGLPISYMSILGNIIFLPFLTTFLFLSTFLLCTELLQIPNTLLAHILNKFVEYWFILLHLGSPKWLIGFAYPGFSTLLFIPIIGWIIYRCTRQIKLDYKCAYGLCAIIIICILLKVLTPTPKIKILQYRNKEVTVHNDKQNLTVTMPRMYLHATGFLSWFYYEAQPILFNCFGLATINTLILINPTPHSKKLVTTQQSVINYKNLIITHPNKQKKTSDLTFYSSNP